MKTLTPFFLAGVLAFCGCVRSVTTLPYSGKLNHGVVYALPKTKLKISATYTVRETTAQKDGIPLTAVTNEIFIAKPVNLEALVVPDAANRFVLSGEGLIKDSRLDSSFKFQLGDNQLLTSVSAEATDKSPEIFQGLVGSALTIAKMAAVAGRGEPLPAPLPDILTRLQSIDREIGALAKEPPSTNKFERIALLTKEQDVLLGVAAKFIERNAAKVKETEVTHTWLLDVSDFKMNGAWAEATISIPPKKLGDFEEGEAPRLKVQIGLSEQELANATQSFFASTNSKGQAGVIYRSPQPVRVRVTNLDKQTLILDDFVQFANVGAFNVVEVKTKTWAKRKTEITFNPGTGSLKEYGVEATSSAEAAAKALDSSLTKVQTALGDIKKAQDAAEATKKSPEDAKLTDLEMQKKLVDAEANLIKAQQELDKLKSGSATN
jgi:hypothetical protein